MSVLYMHQSADFYFKTGMEYLAKKEYFDAITYLRKAVYIEKSEEYILELALAYSTIEAYKESILLYINLLEKKRYLEYSIALSRDCRLYAIKSGFYEFPENGWFIANSHKFKSGQVPQLAYICDNLDFEAIKELSDPAFKEKFLKDDDSTPQNELSYIDTHYKRNFRKTIKAYDEFVKGNYEKTVKIAFTIEKDSEDYEMGQELIIRSALALEDYELAETAANTVYSLYEYNQIGYETLFDLWLKSNKLDRNQLGLFAEKIIEGLLSISSVKRLTDFCIKLSLNSFDLQAINGIKKAFQTNNLNQSYLTCYLGILINAKDYSLAKKMVAKYLKIFPNNFDLVFINWYLKTDINSNEKYFSDNFPIVIEEILQNQFEEEVLSNCKKEGGFTCLTPKAYDILDVIFALQRPEPIVSAMILNEENTSETYQDYLIDKLKHIDVSSACKASIIYSLLNSTKKINKKVIFPYGSSIISSYLKSTEFSKTARGKIFKEVYSAVYTFYLLHKNNIDVDLLINLTKEMQKIKTKVKSIAALSAVLYYYYSKIKNVEINILEIVRVFRTNKSSFKKYMEIFSQLSNLKIE